MFIPFVSLYRLLEQPYCNCLALLHMIMYRKALQDNIYKPFECHFILSISVLKNLPIGMPAALTWAGTRLIAVIPGTVLVSRK